MHLAEPKRAYKGSNSARRVPQLARAVLLDDDTRHLTNKEDKRTKNANRAIAASDAPFEFVFSHWDERKHQQPPIANGRSAIKLAEAA